MWLSAELFSFGGAVSLQFDKPIGSVNIPTAGLQFDDGQSVWANQSPFVAEPQTSSLFVPVAVESSGFVGPLASLSAGSEVVAADGGVLDVPTTANLASVS